MEAPIYTTNVLPVLVKIGPETLSGSMGAPVSRSGTTKTGEKGGAT